MHVKIYTYGWSENASRLRQFRTLVDQTKHSIRYMYSRVVPHKKSFSYLKTLKM